MMSEPDIDMLVLQPENMTIYEAMEVRELFLSSLKNNQTICVNLNQVEEIDSAGLQLMLALKKDALAQHKVVNFVEYSREVQELLALFNLSDFFNGAGESQEKTNV